MNHWDGRSRGSPLGYRIFGIVLRLVGVWPAYLLLWPVSLYFLLVASGARRASLSFFRERLDISGMKAIRMTWRQFFRFGQTLIDRVAVVSGRNNLFRFTFDGEEHLVKMSEDGKGGLIIGAHVGNWNISAHFLTRIPGKMAVLLYDDEWENVKKALSEIEGKPLGEGKVIFIPIKDDLSHLVRLKEILNSGGLVAIHGDRYRPGNRTLEVSFLGAPARVPAGPFLLAASLDLPVTFSVALKESTYRYHLYARPPVNYYRLTGIIREKANQCARDFFSWLEPYVRRHPDQWYNFYDFWKRS
ncbi:MAG: hypothetical protein N2110_00770 [Flavobacteriales bacterium]|nr:hypothetical protein [Flavobacteriales bacterium]